MIWTDWDAPVNTTTSKIATLKFLCPEILDRHVYTHVQVADLETTGPDLFFQPGETQSWWHNVDMSKLRVMLRVESEVQLIQCHSTKYSKKVPGEACRVWLGLLKTGPVTKHDQPPGYRGEGRLHLVETGFWQLESALLARGEALILEFNQRGLKSHMMKMATVPEHLRSRLANALGGRRV